MNYAELKLNDIADGPGVRVTLFVSGCRRHCPGCQNAETWDFNAGKPYTDETEQVIFENLGRPTIAGLTILGGEPFEPENVETINQLAKKARVRFPEKSIWCYTGFTIEDILSYEKPKLKTSSVELLSNLDVLVDGAYVADLRNLMLLFRGSSNQRLIDVQATLKLQDVVLWDK